jgi:2,3-bisphosphoglycerate-independent phosphoglycerate mutase
MPPILIVMLDGLGDRPWHALGGLTPLQAAPTPNLDAFAAVSATGILATLGPGRAPGTELAHFVLFGYPLDAYPGRAVFEAAGQGLELTPDQVALHAIFVTVRPEADGSLTIVERYPGVPAEQIAPLATRVADFSHDGLHIRLQHTVGEQAIVTIGGGASTDITDTDPHNNGWPAGSVRPLDDARDPAAAQRTAEALTAYLRFAYDALAPDGIAPDAERPFLLLKWTGRRQPLAPFPAHTGMRGTIVSSAGVFEGIARELGMEHRRMASLPDLAEDTRMRLAEAAAALADGADFVLMHSKQPDEAGHEKDPVLKRDVIAGIDAGLAGLAERAGLPPDTIVVVTGDHGTPAGTALIHSGDPVPIAILADAMQPDDVAAFDERACAHGRLGHLRGEDLMPVLLNARGTVRYMGGKLSPHTGLHWPRDYEPFRPDGI